MAQADLSAKSGVSKDTISKIETGKRERVGPRVAVGLAAAFGISPADLELEVLGVGQPAGFSSVDLAEDYEGEYPQNTSASAVEHPVQYTSLQACPGLAVW